MDEIGDYIETQKKRALLIAIGVFLCITSLVPPMLADVINSGSRTDSLGPALMFIFIGTAVGLFVYSGVIGGEWRYIEKEACKIDLATADMTRGMRSAFKSFRAVSLTIGCVLCVISIIPCILFDESAFAPAGMFIFVAIGVFLFVYSGVISGGFETVLKINDRETISGKYGRDKDDIEYTSKTAEVIMEVYWPTVTCIYLIYSFLTFNWHSSWVIWIIAWILRKILVTVFEKEED